MHTLITALALPITAFVLIFVILKRRNTDEQIRMVIVKSHLLCLGFIALSTELLSAFNSLDSGHVIAAWSLLCLSLLFPVTALLRTRLLFLPQIRLAYPSPILMRMLLPILFILLTTLLTALLFPPNTSDSMTYHMPRVEHWIANKSVAFYPTAISRQNYQMPLAEFAITHLQLLSGDDSFANLVQWESFCMLIILCSQIARILGANKVGQLIAALVMATMPMAILQASSTQNDLVVAVLILSFAHFMLNLRNTITITNLFYASLSLGLALLTKGTAYIFCAGIGLALAIPIIFKYPINTFRAILFRIVCLFAIVLVALAINTGHYVRCYCFYGTPLSSGGESYLNETFSPRVLLSSIVKNGALHLGTPSSELNVKIHHAINQALGSELINPHTNWPGTKFSITFSLHEDTAGNPIHMLLALLTIAALFLKWRNTEHTSGLSYLAGILCAACLYCLCLKWQPWASRLHTPLFALSVPVTACLMQKYMRKCDAWAAIVLLVCSGLVFCVNNDGRSLLMHGWRNSKQREEKYFNHRPELYKSYKKVMQIVEEADLKDVGLFIGLDDFEYPFWALAKQTAHGTGVRFHHVGVLPASVAGDVNLRVLPSHVIGTKNRGRDTWADFSKYVVAWEDENLWIGIRKGE